MKKKIFLVLVIIVALVALRWGWGKHIEKVSAQALTNAMTPKVKSEQAQ